MKSPTVSNGWADAWGAMFFLLCALALALAGCEQERKVLDVEAPGFELEIRERDSTGSNGLDIDINTPD